jgi:hypothetical protein
MPRPTCLGTEPAKAQQMPARCHRTTSTDLPGYDFMIATSKGTREYTQVTGRVGGIR